MNLFGLIKVLVGGLVFVSSFFLIMALLLDSVVFVGIDTENMDKTVDTVISLSIIVISGMLSSAVTKKYFELV